MDKATALLEHRGIKPTAIRILVLREMMECHEAFSVTGFPKVMKQVHQGFAFVNFAAYFFCFLTVHGDSYFWFIIKIGFYCDK